MCILECLNIYLGWKCNLQCRHCWVSADSKSVDKVETSLIINSIKEAIPLGLKIVKLSGGEPFLYPEDMCQIIDLANAVGLDINIESNGTQVKKEVLDRINPEKAYINISLDGHNNEIHNKMRRNNQAFENTMKGIEIIQQKGIPFGITHTISDKNVDDIDSMLVLLRSIGVNEMKLNPIMTVGRAENNNKFPYLLSLDNFFKVFDKYNDCTINGVHVSTIVPPCFVKPHQLYSRKKKLCTCNYLNMLSILPNGNIGLCGEAKDIEEFCFGNIYQDSLINIWNSSKKLSQLRKNIENIEGVCGKCSYKSICIGGCRIAAYLYEKKLNSPNPIADIYFKNNGRLPYKVIGN